MFPYIDHDHAGTEGHQRGHEHDHDDPVAMAAKVTAHLTQSASQAKAFTRNSAEKYVDELVHAMEHTDERDGRWKLLNTLDRLDDPALRETVLARFQARTGRPLSDVIATSEWHGARDKTQAQALISPARAKTEREIAAMSPAERAKLQADARQTATEIANVIGRDSPNDTANAHKLHRALAGKTPAEIEAIRAAVREQSRGTESLYEQIDRSLSGGNEDEAVASLTGDPVYAASVALQNATGDAPRIVEILRALPRAHIANLKRRFPAATLVWMSVTPDQRAEIGALVNDQREEADGAKVADLLRGEYHGIAADGVQLDAQSQHNREVRAVPNVLRELESMSAEELGRARERWDASAARRGEKTWDAMIEERFGSGDPLTYLRIRALAAGNRVEATALALSQGIRDHDQATIDAALANPELASSDPTKRAAAREHARAIAARVQAIDANKQRAMVAMTGGDVASARGESLDTKLAGHYAHERATQRMDSASDAIDAVLAPDEQAARRRKRAHAAEVGTDELRETGAFSTATELHRARTSGDEARVATVLEGQRDRNAVDAIDADYEEKYGERLFPMLDAEDVGSWRDFQALRGVDVSHEDAERAMRDSVENRVHDVHAEGPRAVRTAETQLRLDNQERGQQQSDANADNELVRKVVFGRAAGSEQRTEWALQSEADAVDGPRAEFDQRVAHTRSMSNMQREEKTAMADRAAQWLAIAGKLAALATLNPAAMAAIDAIVGLTTIYVRGEIEGEAYKTAGADLLDAGITVANDLAMIPIATFQRALLKAAATLGLSSASIMVRNDLSGRSAETTIELLKNLVVSLVVSPTGDGLQTIVGGKLGKALNIGVNTSAGAIANGSGDGFDLAAELAGNANGVVAGNHSHGHVPRGASRPDGHHDHVANGIRRTVTPDHATSNARDPHVVAHGHLAEDADPPTATRHAETTTLTTHTKDGTSSHLEPSSHREHSADATSSHVDHGAVASTHARASQRAQREAIGQPTHAPSALGPHGTGHGISPDDHARIAELRVARDQLATSRDPAEVARAADHVRQLEESMGLDDASPSAAARRRAVEVQIDVQRDAPRRMARRAELDGEVGHPGIEAHSHLMGVVKADVFRQRAAATAGGQDTGSWLPLLEKMHELPRLERELNAKEGRKPQASSFEHEHATTADGGQGEIKRRAKAGDAYAIVDGAKEQIKNLQQRMEGAEGDDRAAYERAIEHLAEEAARTALSSTEETPFDGAYVMRDALVRTTFGSADDRAGGNQTAAFDDFLRETVLQLANDGVRYSEQSTGIKKLLGDTSPERVQAAIDHLVASGQIAPGEVEIQMLAMMRTAHLGGSDERIPGSRRQQTHANEHAKEAQQAFELVELPGVIGNDYGGPEHYWFNAEGQARKEADHARAAEVARKKGQPVVDRPHVGEGAVDTIDGKPFHTDKDRHVVGDEPSHYERARHNIDVMLDGLEARLKNGSLDPARVIVRFGHASHATPEQIKRMRALGVIAEVNLGSNVATGAISQTEGVHGKRASHDRLDDHALPSMLFYGADVLISTDGGAVMNTNLRAEYDRAFTMIEAVLSGNQPVRVTEAEAIVNGTRRGRPSPTTPGVWELDISELTPVERARFSDGYEKLYRDAQAYYQRRPDPSRATEVSPLGGAHHIDHATKHGLVSRTGTASFEGSRGQVDAALAAYEAAGYAVTRASPDAPIAVVTWNKRVDDKDIPQFTTTLVVRATSEGTP